MLYIFADGGVHLSLSETGDEVLCKESEYYVTLQLSKKHI
jgi:hypothetical protein